MQISRLNFSKLIVLAMASQLLLIITLSVGETKSWAAIDWLDIVGEGGAAAVACVWLLFIALSRPAGSVTNILLMGLGLIFFAFWQDLMDEFIKIPPDAYGIRVLESLLMICGLIMLNIGLWQWHQEQKTINNQLRRREQTFRQHEKIDGLTQLGDANYLHQQLVYNLSRSQAGSVALLMIDINNFSRINQRYGAKEGDRLLREMGEILLLNLRKKDLLCRFAGDRFAVLLPNAGHDLAQSLAGQLRESIIHFAFKTELGDDTVYQDVTIGIAMTQTENAQWLIDQANQALANAKQHNEHWCYAA